MLDTKTIKPIRIKGRITPDRKVVIDAPDGCEPGEEIELEVVVPLKAKGSSISRLKNVLKLFEIQEKCGRSADEIDEAIKKSRDDWER